VAGKVVAGPWVRATAARHLKDKEHGPARGLVWRPEEALKKIRFFQEVLCLNGGQFEGRPFLLHPSQVFRVGSLFGWFREDGTRRFRRFYDEEGKGNGKTPMLAGIGLAGMLADGEPRAEVYAAGAKKDQAMVMFRDAVAMVEQSPLLAARLKKSGGTPVWNLGDLETGSFFRPISSDDSQSGPRPHMALCDEVHEHKDRNTVDMLERGFKSRRQPLLVMATNAGSDRHSVCWEEHCHAVNVARGYDDAGQPVVDDSAFSFVCSLDPGDDPLTDPSCWVKANPLLGVTITRDYLERQVMLAKAIPGKRNGILRLNFCVWTEAATAWLEREAWEAVEDPTLDVEAFAGQPCWVGLDIGSSRDLTGRAVVWPDGFKEYVDRDGNTVKQPKFAAMVHGYLPEEGLKEKSLDDKAPYDKWVEDGHLTATPGKVTRLDYVARDCVEDSLKYNLQAVVYDIWLIKRFKEELDALGVNLPTMEHPQGFIRRKDNDLSMPESVKALEELILEGRLRVLVSPPLRSAIMSARFDESPVGLRRFSKLRATGRIDLAVALTMAVGAATGVKSVPVPTYQLFFVGQGGRN
jgi:phage terminase large subunit-like protein